MIQVIPKPENWSSLALFEKIGVYGKSLTKEHSVYIDKLQAKKIVKDILGDKIEVANVVRVLGSRIDLTTEDLQKNYILKASHASGWNISLTASTNINHARMLLYTWSKQFRPTREVQYSFLTPGFFIEERIQDSVLGENESCIVYMFRYIHGKLISIGVGTGVGRENLCNHYDINWNLILDAEIPFHIPKPKQLDDMIQMSFVLAERFEFVRIDLFIDRSEKIYFSEFTLTPKAGSPVFPLQLEKEYGALWT
jgi:hypothetical protein